MRKAMALAAVVTVLATLGAKACAAEIGVVLTGQRLGFWFGMTRGMMRAAQELGVELVVRSPADGSALGEQKNVQLSLIDFMVKRGAVGIVLAPEPLAPDPANQVVPPVSVVVPLVLVDRGSTDYRALSTISTDNYVAGRKAALSLAAVLPRGAKVAVLRLAPNIPSTTARENGFISVAKEKGWSVVLDPVVGYQLREAEHRSAAALKTHAGHLDAIFAPNETVAYGAVRVVSAIPAATRPRLVAFDWRPEFAAALVNGTLHATVLQDNDRMGYQAVAAAVAASRGGKLAPTEVVDVAVVTRANMDEPVIRAMRASYDE